MKELILGGARSGKSRYAEKRAEACGLDVAYIATATGGDAEMQARIHQHRLSRPSHWKTVEAPLYLARALRESAAPDRCLLVDCMTLWLSNALGFARQAGVAVEDAETTFSIERQHLLDTLPGLPGHIILVSNELGQGLVPADPDSRRYRDEAGWLHQDIASCCDRVSWVIAGLPHTLKGDADV